MSASRDMVIALGFCLMFSFMSIEARSSEESSVRTKRQTDDWWSLLEDLLYENDSGSQDEAEEENVLICRNCTVVVQAAPNGTVAPAAGETTPGTAVNPGAPTPASPATPAPATAAPPTAAPATTTADPAASG
ncbi:UV excision repair protein RAD23 homolog B [Drosophila biarmipes]|uniref:UV excision repair protein RAD23 homolog B n=1 Tax=Drosophila biarmipes TaxID=125945 RepID=UPI0007E70710|nr:UV excision repair protein RAD23 homolog B [Drosophila biarmipes]